HLQSSRFPYTTLFRSFLLGRLPHVAQLTFPGPRILRRVRPQTPALAHLVGDLLPDEVGGPAVHRVVAGRIDDQVRFKLRAVLQRSEEHTSELQSRENL